MTWEVVSWGTEADRRRSEETGIDLPLVKPVALYPDNSFPQEGEGAPGWCSAISSFPLRSSCF